MRSNPLPLLALLSVLISQLTATPVYGDSQNAPPSTSPDPAHGEVPLAGSSGWNAFLVLDNHGVPLWTVEPADIFDSHGCPEIVGLDDKGHAQICVSYSGRWTPTALIADPKWLGGFAHGDVDPRIPGAESYIGAQSGNLYQVVAWPNLVLDYRLIASLPGREIHTLAAGQLDPSTPEPEVVAFTVPGGVYLASPTGPNGTFRWKHLGDYEGRVRQALVLPAESNQPPSLVTASRHGHLDLLQIADGVLHWTTLYKTEMGMGRVALRPARPGRALTLYSTLDDGRIVRHERSATGEWLNEVIYNGPQGPRGIVAGQFDANPEHETVAIFGYSKRVELLTHRSGQWHVETIFEDQEKGHWLAAAELDGRNTTTEIVATGYGGRIIYLSRPPGYGTTTAALDTSTPLLVDRFDAASAGELSPPWRAEVTGAGQGRWRYVTDPLPLSKPLVLEQSGVADFALCVRTNLTLQNGYVEVAFRPLSGERDQAGGVVWRFQDPQNYYVCRANALENNVVLYKVKAGKRTPLPVVGRSGGYGVDVPVAPRNWSFLRVEFCGTRHKVIFNSVPLFEVEDDSFEEAGLVGVWTKADSRTQFDDFAVGQRH